MFDQMDVGYLWKVLSGVDFFEYGVGDVWVKMLGDQDEDVDIDDGDIDVVFYIDVFVVGGGFFVFILYVMLVFEG